MYRTDFNSIRTLLTFDNQNWNRIEQQQTLKGKRNQSNFIFVNDE